MRRSKSDTAETRERIVQTAATEFRRRGLAETGIAEVMAAANLTHGGFYRHFDSKNQLAVEACGDALASIIEAMSGGGSLAALVSRYLSPRHRDAPESGCPLAALGSELGRAEVGIRQMAADGFLKLADVIASQMADPSQPRAMVIAAGMIGALTVARIVADAQVSNALLSGMREALLNFDSDKP